MQPRDQWLSNFEKLVPPYIVGFMTAEYAFFDGFKTDFYKIIFVLFLMLFALIIIYFSVYIKQKIRNWVEIFLISFNSLLYIILTSNQSFNFITGDLALLIYAISTGWAFFIPLFYGPPIKISKQRSL